MIASEFRGVYFSSGGGWALRRGMLRGGGGEYSGGPFSTKVSPLKNPDDQGVGVSDGGMIFLAEGR